MILLIALALASPQPAEKPPGSVVTSHSLQPGESLQLRAQSTGCFHFTNTNINVRNRDGVVEAQVLEGPWVRLTEAEQTGLGRRLELFASATAMGCTTVEYLQITHRSRFRTLSHAEYTDGSCAVYDIEEATPLLSLSTRLAEAEADTL